MGSAHQDPAQVLTEEQAHLLLKRASEIEAQGEPISYAELQAAATEAGLARRLSNWPRSISCGRIQLMYLTTPLGSGVIPSHVLPAERRP